ncbi:DUF2262 domain-containing protein [Saccharibacillus sp. JS10]|uniref:DUF2262 domain-containing protein n=1 Tax=Saccharibacillus sp. JS10 TaxID=2950552 RepID=UPI00210C79A0|nr:DUF2262 domain-containing protein [Saccharibacillus sp. JS10]MCQ4086396.1 DUF2262 domain-containing protein [Saccharibacillus sp. JS10]
MYYDTSNMLNMIQQAYAQDDEAIQQITGLQTLRAFSPDYAHLIVIQPKHAIIKPDGRIRILNQKAADSSQSWLCADLYRCFPSGGASWTHIPFPASFVPVNIDYEQKEQSGGSGQFVFRSDQGDIVRATPMQIGFAFRDLDLVMGGVTEEEMENEFLGMAEIVVPAPPIVRTAQDNPPIDWADGTFVFQPESQVFSSEYQFGEHRIEIRLEQSERKQALESLDRLEKIVGELPNLDLAARCYAAKELLELKNDSWLDEDEEECSETIFIQRMQLESLTLSEDGDLAFWYEDGDLFWGHSICVHRSGKEQWLSADMMG